MLGIVLPASYIILEALLEASSDRNRNNRKNRDHDPINKTTTMAHIRDDMATSIANNSIFDWGFGEREIYPGGDDAAPSSSSSGRKGSEKQDSPPSSSSSGGGGPSSRYDPKAMSRIVDITDLVDDSEDSSDEADEVFETVGVPRSGGDGRARRRGSNNGRGGSSSSSRYRAPRRGKQILVVTAITAIVVGAAASIGYILVNSDALALGGGGGGGGGNDDASSSPQRQQQELLMLAERVALACDDTSLEGSLADCEGLCEGSSCCFDDDIDCDDDDGMVEEVDCPIYAGCLSLTDGWEEYDRA